jgi:Putative Actinobacterial Holin-X, holin superfamily III
MSDRFKVVADNTAAKDTSPNNRPAVTILREMISHLGDLVRAEVKLVSLEVRQDIAAKKSAAVSIVVANGLLLYGGAFLLAAIVVGAALGIIGIAVLAMGVQKIKSPRPK